MRIIIETLSYPPNVSGVAVFVSQLSESFAQAGHDVHIITTNNHLKTVSERRGNLTVHRLRSFPNPIRRGFYLPWMVRRLVSQLIEEIQPDVIHVNDPMATSRYLQAAGDRLGIPTIVSNHFGMEYVLAYVPKFSRRLIQAYIRQWMIRFYNQCDRVVAPSESALRALKKLGVTAPLQAVSNGVDLHRFFIYFPLDEYRQKYALPDRPLVLYVGRIDKDKSIPVLLKAFEKVSQETNAQLVLVGSGSKAKALLKPARAVLGDRLRWLGPINHESDDLVALYQLADIFVMPSAIETQSISTLEAMAAGRPVVAANGGALPELVRDHQNGRLFPPGDSQILARCLIELLNSPTEQERSGASSLERVTAHELEACHDLYATLYGQCRVARSSVVSSPSLSPSP